VNPVVLYEDNHLLVIDKPAGMVAQGALPGAPSVVDWAKDYLKRKYSKPGNVFIGVVSRLDRDVSGVLVLARTSKGAARLNEQFRERTVEKIYWAVVDGSPPAEGRCEDLLGEDREHGRTAVVAGEELGEGVSGDARPATLEFRRLATAGEFALLEVRLETGRKHQIRVQLAARGWSIVGDRKYGSRRSFPDGIALHAQRLKIAHPTRVETVVVEAPVPAAWHSLGFREIAK